MEAPVLFFFTKTYPYGKGEQYIDEELPLLAQSFSKIIIIPCSIFGETGPHQRTLPGNVEIFAVNNHLLPKTIFQRIRNFFFYAGVFTDAAIHNKDGAFFWKQLKTYRAIFRQQLACAAAVAHFIRTRKYNTGNAVFYSYWVHNSCIISGILKRRGIIPHYITRAHSYDLYHRAFYPEHPDKSPLAWERFKFKTADRVFCISEHGAKFLSARYPQWKEKFVVSRLGIDNPDALNPAAAPGEVFRIVTCSTVQPLKRLNRIPELLSLLDFPVEWIHFGAGDERYEQELKEAWKKFQKPEHRFIFKGFTPNAEVKQFYGDTHIDLFMNMSIAEGVPVSLMEAAGYGIPLLATDVYGSSEVATADAGFLVRKDFTAEEAAAAIRKLKTDPQLAEQLRNGARKVQRTFFDAGKNFRTFTGQLKEWI